MSDKDDPNLTIGPQEARRPSRAGVTQHFTAIKVAKAAKAADNPRRALVESIGRKLAGVVAVVKAYQMWQAAEAMHAKLQAANPAADPGHFSHYAALGVGLIGFYLTFPDVFTALLATIKPFLPWGKKDEA